MNKLRALTTYLIGLNLVLPEQIDSWAEQVNLDLIWKDTTEGLHMGDMRYRAVLVIERFAGNPALLMALLGGWLESNDPDRDDDLPAPSFAVDQVTPDELEVIGRALGRVDDTIQGQCRAVMAECLEGDEDCPDGT